MSIVSTPSASVARDTAARDTAAGQPSWQGSLGRAIRDVGELCRRLDLPSEWAEQATDAAADFPLLVTEEYLHRIEPGNPHDPLLRQILPVLEERQTQTADRQDPVGDAAAELTPGLLHKYQGRVLLVTTGACPVHCRYCFRRHYPYGELPKSNAAWQSALEQIAADTTIEEVILSGGDPLMLPDERLAALADSISQISHVRRLRVHTRMPVLIPSRIDPALLDWLSHTRLSSLMVIHANHPREIDADVAAALRRLIEAGVPVLNQAVLLAGVNDNAETLVELSQRLVDLGVFPYYLHQLDRVAGAAHFEVPVERGRELITAMRTKLPGYAVPRYVQEIAGEPGKTVLL